MLEELKKVKKDKEYQSPEVAPPAVAPVTSPQSFKIRPQSSHYSTTHKTSVNDDVRIRERPKTRDGSRQRGRNEFSQTIDVNNFMKNKKRSLLGK